MNISGYSTAAYGSSLGGIFSPEETQKLKGTMQQSQTLGILGSIPSANAYVLDVGLLNQIYDAKAITPATLNSYASKVEEAYGVTSKPERYEVNKKVEAEADKEVEDAYLSPQEEIAQRLKELENPETEETTEEVDQGDVVIETVEDGENPFIS